jgi:hypothetical protein
VNVELEGIGKGTGVVFSMYFLSIEGDAYRETEDRCSPADIRTLDPYCYTNLRSRNSRDRKYEQNYRTEQSEREMNVEY